jgi:hypothetical protein
MLAAVIRPIFNADSGRQARMMLGEARAAAAAAAEARCPARRQEEDLLNLRFSGRPRAQLRGTVGSGASTARSAVAPTSSAPSRMPLADPDRDQAS